MQDDRPKRDALGEAEKAPNQSAEQLASEVVDADDAVLSLLVLSSTGGVLAVKRSSRLLKSDYMDDKDMAKFGTMAKVITGMAANAEPLMGEMDFIAGEFKKHKVVFINTQREGMTLAIRASRSANGEYLCRKILNELKRTSGEQSVAGRTAGSLPFQDLIPDGEGRAAPHDKHFPANARAVPSSCT